VVLVERGGWWSGGCTGMVVVLTTRPYEDFGLPKAAKYYAKCYQMHYLQSSNKANAAITDHQYSIKDHTSPHLSNNFHFRSYFDLHFCDFINS
jgi:hypothetical protein